MPEAFDEWGHQLMAAVMHQAAERANSALSSTEPSVKGQVREALELTEDDLEQIHVAHRPGCSSGNFWLYDGDECSCGAREINARVRHSVGFSAETGRFFPVEDRQAEPHVWVRFDVRADMYVCGDEDGEFARFGTVPGILDYIEDLISGPGTRRRSDLRAACLRRAEFRRLSQPGEGE